MRWDMVASILRQDDDTFSVTPSPSLCPHWSPTIRCSLSYMQGDGVTWTGMGGLLSPLGEEFIAPPHSLAATDYRFISFCISGANPNPLQPGESCPMPVW